MASNNLITYFDQVASSYNRYAFLPKIVGENLLERLDFFDFFKPQNILDVGCGTGFCLQLLNKRYPNARFYGIDLSHTSLKQVQFGYENSCKNLPMLIQANLEYMPMIAQQFDLICANLSIMWTKNIKKFFETIYNLLKPNGLFLMATLGLDTIKEINHRQKTLAVYPNAFHDMHTVGDLLISTNLSDVVLDTDLVQINYNTFESFKCEMQQLGLDNLFVGLHQLDFDTCSFKNKKFSTTWEMIYSQAWKKEMEQIVDNSKPVYIPITTIKRSLS